MGNYGDFMILGLDISTTITGYCLINSDGNIYDIGDINFKKYGKDIFKKLDYISEWIDNYIHIDKIKVVIVESPLRRFKAGQSSAQTLFNLYSFNIGIQYMFYKKFGKPPLSINATTARKRLGIVTPKGLSYKDRKQFIFEHVRKLVPDIKWEYTRFGNPKDGSYDRADAYCIAYSEWLNRKK